MDREHTEQPQAPEAVVNHEPAAKAASAAEITSALAPYVTTGPSGLSVRINTQTIFIQREQRKTTFPRNASIDSLIDAAVDMSGPLTPQEVEKLFEPYKAKGVQMKIEDDMLYFTRKQHVATFKTHDGKIKNSNMRERTVSSSLDVPMAHIISVLNEITGGGEMFE